MGWHHNEIAATRQKLPALESPSISPLQSNLKALKTRSLKALLAILTLNSGGVSGISGFALMGYKLRLLRICSPCFRSRVTDSERVTGHASEQSRRGWILGSSKMGTLPREAALTDFRLGYQSGTAARTAVE